MANSIDSSAVLLRVLSIALVGVLLAACGDGQGSSRELGGSGDVYDDAAVDGGDSEDSDADAGPEAGQGDAEVVDTGPIDVGSCNCSYGFHSQCAVDELCAGYPSLDRSETLTCEPQSARSSPSKTPATAQCEPAAEQAPCRGVDRMQRKDLAYLWWSSMALAFRVATGSTAATSAYLDERYLADPERLTSVYPECGEFLKWTAVSFNRLCQGDGTVVSPEHEADWGDIRLWRFTNLPAVNECLGAAGVLCYLDLEGTLETGEVAERLNSDNIFKDCPDGLPFGAPCGGLDPEAAKACLEERMRFLLSALLR